MARPTILSGTPRGVQTTQNIDQTGNMRQMDFSRSERLFTVNYRAAPFQILTNAILAHEEGFGHDYRWQNDELPSQLDTLAGSVTSATAIMAVTNGNLWTVYDNLYIPSAATASTPGAQAVVTEISGNNLTITWVVAPTGALAPGVLIFRQGNTYPERSFIQNGPITIPGENYNYLTDVRHGLEATERMLNGKYWLRPDKFERDLTKKGQEHFLALEKIYLFGRRALLGVATTPSYCSRGLYHWAATNRTSLGNAALTKAAFDTWLNGVIQANQQPTQNWYVFCDGQITGRAISNIFATIERSSTAARKAGMWINEYQSPTGPVINIVQHPLFYSHGYTATAILVNLTKDALAIVMGRNEATQRRDSIMPYGLTSKQAFYKTVTTLRATNEATEFGVLEDFTL